MKSMIKLARYLKPYWLAAVLAPLLMALEVAMDLSQPRLLQGIIDIGIANGDLAFVVHQGAVMIVVALIGMVGGVGCTIYATTAAMNLGADVRADLYRKVQQLSFGNLDRLEIGGLITRLTNDVDRVHDAVAMFLRILVRAPLLVVGSMIMAVITCPSLSVLIFVIGGLLVFAIGFVSRKAHPMFTAVQERLDRVNTVMRENLMGVRVVKAFVRSDHECRRFGTANDNLANDTISASALVASMMPLMMLLMNLGVVAVIWFGGLQVQRGSMQVGQILAFVNYLVQMLHSLMMMSMILMNITRAEASAERIVELLDTDPEIQNKPDALTETGLNGKVEFENVGFAYRGNGGEPVLQNITFTVEPGQTVAILGSTGSGKSTLVQLIPRLYDVTEGRVLIDGMDVRDIAQETLLQRVGVVFQQATLFSGTIRENISYGRPEASDAEVAQAAGMASAHEFISSLADGYDAVLGQQGVNLSGGQKQRLALARELVQHPAVLILDDCTSAVDASTEASIVRALKEWDHPCTKLIVAQRINTVFSADKVIVLEDGRIAAQGTHAELLKTSEAYRGIVQSQIGDKEHINA